MSVQYVRRAIKFMREQFTHLDSQVIQDSNLHADLFIDLHLVRDLKERLRQYLKDKNLHESGDPDVPMPKPVKG